MKQFYLLLLLLLFFPNRNAFAQCGGSEFCNANTGLYSNNNATDIAYDNMGSAFHASFIKEPNGGWRVWGANVSNTGTSVLSPLSVNATNYPALTGTIYKLAIGSSGGVTQLVVLTSTGLFVCGTEGTVIDNVITTSSVFQKITVNGKTDGLPIGVNPNDVKMLFVSTQNMMVTTCSGEVHVLARNAAVRGNGGVGFSTQWAQVKQDADTPLSNVIVARGTGSVGFALKADGTLWTWGFNTFLGNNTTFAIRNYATQMTLPPGMPAVKMIQLTTANGSANSYYILGTDKKIYSLGLNTYGQLGDLTTATRQSWVNAVTPQGNVISDAAWISSNEHDQGVPALSVIRNGGLFYTGGNNSFFMIGQPLAFGANYLNIPAGINATDVITYAEVGGHSTAVIKLGSLRYGYVGHRIQGSMGDGTSTNETQESFDFETPPIVAVCGTICTEPVLTTNSPICPGGNATFTISGTAGDIVSYTLNGGNIQTATIGTAGSVTLTASNVTSNQNIELVYILGGTGACANNLSITATVTVGGNVIPAFTQVAPICSGQTLISLPTTSNNGINGTWSPPVNNTATTTYTFTSSGNCASQATMTIVVNPLGAIPLFTQVVPVCLGGTLNPLPTISNNNISGTWSPPVNNNATTTYTFTPTLAGCIQNATMTIQVLPGTIPTFTQVAPVCSGDAIAALPLISNNTISGSWSPPINNLATTIYTFTPTAEQCATNAQMTIVVNPKPTPLFNQVAPICEGSFLANLPLSSTNGIAGTWSPPINNLTTTTYIFTPATGVCAQTVSMTIVVDLKDDPIFPIIAPLCYAEPGFSLPTVSNNGISGNWSPQFSNTQSALYTFLPDSDECANPASMQVTVFDDFDFDYTKYCLGGNLMLQIFPVAETFDMESTEFNWQKNTANVGDMPIFNVTSYLNGTPEIEKLPVSFDITVTDVNGCDKTKTITLDHVYCNLQKGISPNGDKLNDFFDLRLLDVKHLSIFNRYGLEVYSKDNYYDEWHGQTDKGEILPDATYYYRIDFENDPPKTGWIYVINEK